MNNEKEIVTITEEEYKELKNSAQRLEKIMEFIDETLNSPRVDALSASVHYTYLIKLNQKLIDIQNKY